MKKKQLNFLLVTMFSTSIIVPNQLYAAAFQLWEQDAASIGNYHAGRVAIAEDASTAFYNPAGLVKIPSQEVVIGVVPITTDFLFDGTIAVEMLLNNKPQATKGQGGSLNFVPNLHYSAPISDRVYFGFSTAVPFGLQTNYGNTSLVRYAATKTALQVVDISPSLAFALSKQFSIGAGVDIEYSQAQFDLVATALSPSLDTEATNSLSGHGLGYHVGLLYQFTPKMRMGLSYQSKVTHHFRDGTSKFTGPLANSDELITGGVQSNKNLRTDATLPATTSLSFFDSVNAAWDIMGTLSYTQWSVFNDVILYNVSGIDDVHGDIVSSDAITVFIPENFHNTWNYALGANYHINEQWFLRAGIGYDETPSNNVDRNLQLPDADRYVTAIGAHYQATKTLAFDIAWSHFFAQTVSVDVTEVVGAQVTTSDGSVTGNADVYGLQMKWDIL